MDFDQMLETWRAQDVAPLYGVNRDALRQALRTEDADVLRKRRRDMWIICVGVGGTAILAGFWVAISIFNGWPAIYTVAAGLGFAMCALYVGAYCVSRRRQAKRERIFGNSLQEEVRRTLSRVEFEISLVGNWRKASLQTAPILVGALLIFWAVGKSQGHNADVSPFGWWIYLSTVFWIVYLVRVARRRVKEKLEPRQHRLRELLAALDAQE